MALSIEILGQGSETLPVHKRLRPCDGGKAFANLFRKVGRAPRLSKFQAQASFDSRIAAAYLDKQLGQTLGAEGRKIFPVKGCSSGHSLFPSAKIGIIAHCPRPCEG